MSATGWLDALLTEPVTILTAARTEDEYGRDVPDWADAVETDALARFQPGGESETLLGRDQQSGDALLYLPAGTPITGRDRVVVAEQLYEVLGPPRRLRVPWSDTEHHVRAALRRIDGL